MVVASASAAPASATAVASSISSMARAFSRYFEKIIPFSSDSACTQSTYVVAVGLVARMAWVGKVVVNHPPFDFHGGRLPT